MSSKDSTGVVSATANWVLKPSCSDTPICLDVLSIPISGLLPALYITPGGPNVIVSGLPPAVTVTAEFNRTLASTPSA